MSVDPGRVVTLRAGDQTYQLYIGNRALRLFERETGRTVSALDGSLSLNDLTCLVWAGLQQCHPGVSLEQVDEIIDAAGYDVVSEAINQAAAKTFGQSQQSGNPLVAGTGTPPSEQPSSPVSATSSSGS